MSSAKPGTYAAPAAATASRQCPGASAAAPGQEQPARAYSEQEAQVSPAVAPAAASAAAGSGRRGRASSAPRSCAAARARLDHHLARELHARGAQSSFSIASRKPRRPQWKSRTGPRKKRRPSPVRTGLPRYRAATASRRARCRPRTGCPSPGRGRRAADRRTVEPREVVAVVGVAHDHELAARRRCHPSARCRNPAVRTATTRAPSAVAICCEPSVLPLSATTTSPAIERGKRVYAFWMQTAIVSASLRHGMMIESSIRGS